MNLRLYKTAEEVVSAFAEYFCLLANETISQKRRFSVALSGGNSPKAVFQLLVSQYRDKLDWRQIDFFFGDERNVPQTHKDSNYLMAKENLFDPLGISQEQVFPVDTSLEPAAAASQYSEVIGNYFSDRPHAFDLVTLGLGDDAHTASLFPGTPVINEMRPVVKAVFVEKLDTYRITMSAPLLNMAVRIAFLLYGPGKAEAVHAVWEKEKDQTLYPAQLIRSDADWFLDEAAASRLKK